MHRARLLLSRSFVSSPEMEDAASSQASPDPQSLIERDQTEKPTPSQAMLRLGQLWTVSMALRAVVELKVADIIAQAGVGAFLTPREIAAHIPNSTDFTVRTVSRFLRLLTAHSVFTERVTPSEAGGSETFDRKFALNELSRTLLADAQDGLSFRELVIFLTENYVQKGGHYLSKTAVDGEEPFVKAYGIPIWQYQATRPELGIVFDKFMAAVAKNLLEDVVRDYAGLRELKGKLVDVAGGHGTAVARIVKAHQHIRGINFDQPHVIATAPAFPGVEHVAGDMFEKVPEGDAVFLKWILHDWDDEACLKLLRNIHKALPSHGKLIIMEAVVPEETDQTHGTQAQLSMDMLMLTINVGGKERTQAEYRKLVTDAGFSKLEIVYTRDAHFSAMEVSV